MKIITKNNQELWIRKLDDRDLDLLSIYLANLSEETRRRFGPHPFDRYSLSNVFEQSHLHSGYIAINPSGDEIAAYSIIRKGFLEHDSPRLSSYGLTLDHSRDCTYAPSVADAWQGKGIGEAMFSFILEDLNAMGFSRMILWGGVQCSNLKAVGFYNKLGFTTLGKFEYHGENHDMILEF
jgi:diamine N-acetyltransferase